MINFCSKLIFFLIIMASHSLGLAYNAYDFSEAKRIARMIWSEHPETFYCGCRYDRHGMIDFRSCDYRPRDHQRDKRISWEHVMPVSWYGHRLACWKKKGGRAICRQEDPYFRMMEADLHNLVPAIMEINKRRKHFGYADVSGGKVPGCDFKIDPQRHVVEPREAVKGMVARIMLYMSEKYQIAIKPQDKLTFLRWNQHYPPSGWEKRWHEKVFTLQGDRNPYIYYYDKNRGKA